MPSAGAAEALTGSESAGRALLSASRGAFDRLDPSIRGPLAVGFSGGSDSLSLLLATRAWAAACGRPVIALTVDHGLNPQSAAWTASAAATAAALGIGFRALAWRGEKPAAGLPSAARDARHRLLAEAARTAGARVLLLGHTADDVEEARRMRLDGASVGAPRAWSPSPVWPEGRELMLLRPLLGLRREALRELVAPSRLGWIEDPANDNPAFARARARRAMASADLHVDAPPRAAPALPKDGIAIDDFGAIRIRRTALQDLKPGEARRLLQTACVCAGGGDRLPRQGRTEALLARLLAGAPLVATLAGARVEAGEDILVCRDAGRIPSCAPHVAVWDGRFAVARGEPAAALGPLRGMASRLPEIERGRLKALPAAVRPGLVVMRARDGDLTSPLLAERPAAAVRCLVRGRFAAAAGWIASETECARGPDGEHDIGALS